MAEAAALDEEDPFTQLAGSKDDDPDGMNDCPPEDLPFAEMVGFLQDKKVAVQRLAAEALLDQTETLELIEYCKRKPRIVARSLLRLAERAEAAFGKAEEGSASNKASANKARAERILELENAESSAAGAAALKALVNLSAVPAVCSELVDMNAARRCCEALRSGWLEGRSDLAHWYSMLLANLSTLEACQQALCKEEGFLRFLFSAFVSKQRPPPRDGYDDPMLCLAKVINNVCFLKEGRAIFAVGESSASTMSTLAAELASRQRRPDITSAFRNLCLDKECHTALVQTDLLARLARFLYPWEKAEPARREELPAALREVLEADGATLTGDVAVRQAGAQCLYGLCLSAAGRAYLREGCCSEVLRAWQEEEVDEDTRTSLASAMSFLSQSEDELAAAEALEAKEEGYAAGEQPPVAGESQ